MGCGFPPLRKRGAGEILDFMNTHILKSRKKERVNQPQTKQWPQSILSFKGVPDTSAFELTRDELLLPREILL